MRHGLILAMVLVLYGGSVASACPYCRSDLGQEVAAGIFNREFGWNALAMLLPLLILTGIVFLIQYEWPHPQKPNDGETFKSQDSQDNSPS